jgi:inosose dehydratase
MHNKESPAMTFRVGLNPLPWVLTANGFDLSVSVLRHAFGEISRTPFVGIHADPPADLDADGYRQLLAEFGLEPAPGYFSARFADETTETLVEAAKRHAAIQAALGNTEVFLADSTAPIRRGTPAVGADADPDRLQRVIDRIGAAAEAITAEGVRPALHPHVGTWVEIEPEVEAVLAGVPDTILGFGPDTGHLSWAGMDAVAVMARHADRIAAVHLKDVRLDQAAAARAAMVDYWGSTRGPYQVWTEPGRGDVDLLAAITTLPAGFAGWVIVEVDVPEAPTNLESTEISARWVADHYGSDVF